MRMHRLHSSLRVPLIPSCVLAAVVLCSGPAAATLHDRVIVGEVLSRNGPIFDGGCAPSGTVGSMVRVDYRWDDSVADQRPADTTWGIYASVLSWRLRFAGILDQAAGPSGGVIIYDDRPLQGLEFLELYEVILGGMLTEFPTGCVAAGASGGQLQLDLFDEATTANPVMTSDAQPTTPPSVSAFNMTREIIISSGNDSYISVGVSDLYVLGSPSAPVLPTTTVTRPNGDVVWIFNGNCIANCWYDPPFADGFLYETDGASLFTSIDDFPSGFAAPFEVWVDGTLLGSFGPGQTVDFTGYPGGGVQHFSIRGITPGADVEDQQAFPLQLSLDVAPVSFTMT